MEVIEYETKVIRNFCNYCTSYEYFSALHSSCNCTKGNNGSMNFEIDLTGYRLYGFGDFNQLGYKITPLAQLYFRIIQMEQEWIDEPLLYIKGNKGYVHLWKKTVQMYFIQLKNRQVEC